MKFGIDHLFTWRGDRSQRAVLRDAVEQTVLADDLGFDGCWLAEHHFSNYGIVGHLPTMAATLAEATERLRIGLAVVVLPFAHPLRLAEELALVDVISGGRLDVGVGRGYQPGEFAHFGIPFEEASARFTEVLEVMKLAWTRESFSHEGRFYNFRDVSVFPRPLQSPHPPVLHAAVSSSTFERAGRLGVPILTSPNFTPIEMVRDNFTTYRNALRDSGHEPASYDYPMLQQVYVAEDPAEARDFPRDYAMFFYKTLSRLLPNVDHSAIPGDYQEYEKIQHNIERLRYDYLLEHGINVGTPDQVIERIKILQQEAGVNYYIGWFNFGGMPNDKVLRSMELFANEVMPAFQRDGLPSPQAG
jgi:alkanesulfonate monooxygenase SsuD/methylene tetrahydromethanopterin reductase-like flavin-dependent oxidoreductase (luciferase family)